MKTQAAGLLNAVPSLACWVILLMITLADNIAGAFGHTVVKACLCTATVQIPTATIQLQVVAAAGADDR